MSELPGILARVAEEVGEAVALRFAAEFGGHEIYLPDAAHIGPDHRLAVALGLETARRVAEALAPPGRLIVPRGPASWQVWRKAEVRRRMDRGESVSTIARAVGVHERAIYYQRARMREQEAERGPDLFDLIAPKPR